MEILEFTSKEAAAPLMSVAAPMCLEILEKKIQNFGFFLKILKIMENLGKFRIIISKVGGKFRRWEGYVDPKCNLPGLGSCFI